jgi:hypothetical protein
LGRRAPSNRLVAWVRAGRHLRRGLAAALIGVACWWAAAVAAAAAGRGGAGWLHLVFVWLLWDAVKLTLAGPAGLVWAAQARWGRRARPAPPAEAPAAAPAGV